MTKKELVLRLGILADESSKSEDPEIRAAASVLYAAIGSLLVSGPILALSQLVAGFAEVVLPELEAERDRLRASLN